MANPEHHALSCDFSILTSALPRSGKCRLLPSSLMHPLIVNPMVIQDYQELWQPSPRGWISKGTQIWPPREPRGPVMRHTPSNGCRMRATTFRFRFEITFKVTKSWTRTIPLFVPAVRSVSFSRTLYAIYLSFLYPRGEKWKKTAQSRGRSIQSPS